MAAQQVLTNVDLLEIILSSLPVTTLTTVRRIARPWREAVDNSPTNSEVQKKQFYTAIPVRKMVKKPRGPYPSLVGGLSVTSTVTSIIDMLTSVEHYLLIDVHPAFDPYRERSLSVVNFGFAIPLRCILNMQNSSFERAFVTQPPITKVLALQHDYMPACFRKVKIVTESGVTFGDIIKAIIPLAKVIYNIHQFYPTTD